MSSLKMCELKPRDLKPQKLAKLVRDPRYYCERCARVSNEKKKLCKPRKLPD